MAEEREGFDPIIENLANRPQVLSQKQITHFFTAPEEGVQPRSTIHEAGENSTLMEEDNNFAEGGKLEETATIAIEENLRIVQKTSWG